MFGKCDWCLSLDDLWDVDDSWVCYQCFLNSQKEEYFEEEEWVMMQESEGETQ